MPNDQRLDYLTQLKNKPSIPSLPIDYITGVTNKPSIPTLPIDYLTQITNKPTIPTQVNLPFLNSNDYNFTPQQPGGSLIVGANAITLNPMPSGLSAASINNSYLYISNGTGAAENVLIVGWTSTTVTVTCANTHSGAWTIQSDTDGIQEAIIAAGPIGRVVIPAGLHTIRGKITIPGSYKTSLRGSGAFTTILQTSITTGDFILYNTGAAAGVDLGDFGINDLTGTFHTSGAMIKILNRPYGVVSNIWMDNAYDGIIVGDNSNTFYSNIFISCFHNGLTIQSTVQSGGGYCNILVSTNGANAIAYLITGQTVGVSFTACGCGAAINTTTNYGVYILQPSVGLSNELCFTNCILDGHGTTIIMVGTGTYKNNSVIFTGCRINGFYYGFVANGAWNGIRIIGCTVYGATAGILWADVRASSIVGCHVNGTTAGINLSGGTVSDIIIKNNGIGKDVIPGYGIALAGTLINVQIGDNDISFSTAAFLFSSLGYILNGNNIGLDNLIGTVADAATVTFPPNLYFTLTGTGTAVTAIAGLWVGRHGYFICTNASPPQFTAGATIGNTFTPVQNKLVNYYFDGTKIYLS